MVEVNHTMTDGLSGFVHALLSKDDAALLMLLGFSVFAVLLAVLYNVIRRYVFNDVNNLDSTFDAGGNVSTSLTAVTIASQLLWPADILQSATGTVKYGVSGAFWYSTCVVVSITLFPILSFHFKTRAPGAKTYLQVIESRFGKAAHTVFCFFALLQNLLILTAIIVVGTALLQALVNEASPEFCVLMTATMCGCYSFVGGLGSTFYVSYFNAVVIFATVGVLIFNIFYSEHSDLPTLGNFQTIYQSIGRLEGPQGNEEKSYLSFRSEEGMVWAVLGLTVTIGITFCDQANWQSRIAAKPVQGVLGFLVATFLWFSVPTTVGTTTGLIYLALVSENSSLALSAGEIDAGLVTPYIAELVMGRAGVILIITMLSMLVMSTGSGEIMAISSIIVYDIFQIYIKPFRLTQSPERCILCGCRKREDAIQNPTHSLEADANCNGGPVELEVICKCPPVSECEACAKDTEASMSKDKAKSGLVHVHVCRYHGEYRMYQDSLIGFKNWCLMWVSLGLVPFGLIIKASGIDLNWIMLTGFTATVPAVPGILLSLVWVKTSGLALTIGSIAGLVCGICVNLIYASTLPFGLNHFLLNTSNPYVSLAGSVSSFVVSLVLAVFISLGTHNIHSPQDEQRVWSKLRSIDNPLHPWAQSCQQEFPQLKGIKQPTFEELNQLFKTAKFMAIVGCVVSIGLLDILIPAVMTSLHVLTENQFRAWVTTTQVWCVVMGAVVLFVTPVEEVIAILKQILKNRRQRFMSTHA